MAAYYYLGRNDICTYKELLKSDYQGRDPFRPKDIFANNNTY